MLHTDWHKATKLTNKNDWLNKRVCKKCYTIYTKKASAQAEVLLRNAKRTREETCRALSTSMNEITIFVTFNRKFRLKAGEGEDWS